MPPIISAFVRALGNLLLPRVIALSLLPLLVMGVLASALSWLFWDRAVAAMQASVQSSALIGWLGQHLALDWPGGLAGLLGPLLVVALATPVIALTALLAVALLMTPALTRLVAKRRFPALERRHGASLLVSIAWSAGALLAALVALVLTLPLWLIGPLVLVLPPLIWGWLTYRVMSFDALAEFASADERRAILRRHRWPLLLIGIVSGYLGAAPSVVWASGVAFAALFMVMMPLGIWIYTLVFAFSSLWFAHYCLQALQVLRAGTATALPPAAPKASTPPPAAGVEQKGSAP